jgi:hypothetical protein
MKKLIGLIITLVLVLGLGACSSAPADTDLEDRVEVLEEQVIDLQETLDNMVVSVGLNGQTSYYVNDKEYELSQIDFVFLAQETEYLDASKFPAYIWDDSGEYITVNDMVNMLTQKYLGVSSMATTGYQFKIKLSSLPDMNNEEMIVAMSMMIVELANYDFYTIDSPELYIEISGGGLQMVKVRMTLLVSDKYDLHPAVFWNEMMDTRIVGLSYNESGLDLIYDNYINAETFIGYVLNYQ